ncbi:GTP cyclohydrolase II RibA [Psychromonas algicola]|uniref:GTP cyclohydrolase II RibA n=1 Tax=Psychromonas algicola TaxID=2555642 RepID=UPI0010672A9A|nr:GTP cyclohydrolase II RibA [Psychromonas sp. RZ5]TEW47127.1 GTP cyclohydrolase II RibA [Psychromonas sp. RZ5]
MNTIRARINLKVGLHSDIDAEIATFTMFDENHEHIALIFQQADKNQQVPLVRMHSECLTGDVFHSSRCDCGEQLDETINLMKDQGGVILYLRQEGRGIGLYNKMDAYVLQSQGMDTYQANKHLGFEEDARSFEDAALMLRALEITDLRLITNNPKKINALKDDFNIVEQVNTALHLKEGNSSYLRCKKSHGKHDLKID